jgi:hypothetical protein
VRSALVVLTAILSTPLSAQEIIPRSSTYLFSANVEDARALWINPAGLGILPLATIYAEAAGGRAAGGGDWGLRQYSFGLHSRNLAVSYQKDRFATGGSDGTWRVGAAFPLAVRMAIGTAVTFTSPERTIDLGLRFSPARPLDVGLVVRNIGRPTVRGVPQPISTTAGMAWRLARGRIGIQADAVATERRPLSGYDTYYRGGALFVLPGRQPVSFLTALDFDSDLRVSRLSVGIAFGLQAQLLAVGTTLPGSGSSTEIQSFNVTGVAFGRANRR